MAKPGITLQKVLWLALAYATFAAGLIGAFLPILPTTPFLLVAVWAGSHASSNFRWWLLRHKRFGPALRLWYREKAIARPAKRMAVAVICASWLVIILSGRPAGVVALTGLVLLSCIVFLVTRPEPRKDEEGPRT